MAAFDRRGKGLYLAVITLGIDLVVGEYGIKAVAGIEVFDVPVILVNLLNGDAEDSGRHGFESQFIHLRETVDTL